MTFLSLILILLFLFSFLLIYTKSPYVMMINLLFLTMSITLFTHWLTPSHWKIYFLLMLYLGGLFLMFIYMITNMTYFFEQQKPLNKLIWSVFMATPFFMTLPFFLSHKLSLSTNNTTKGVFLFLTPHFKPILTMALILILFSLTILSLLLTHFHQPMRNL